MRYTYRTPFLLGLFALYLSGCGGDGGGMSPSPVDMAAIPSLCLHETRADTYAPGLEKTGQQGMLIVTLLDSQPGPLAIGVNTWDIKVRDSGGTERSDLSITAVPWMPDDNHGTSVKASVIPAATAGQYTVSPLYLFMAGLWQITLKMQLPNQTVDQAVFSFCLDDN